MLLSLFSYTYVLFVSHVILHLLYSFPESDKIIVDIEFLLVRSTPLPFSLSLSLPFPLLESIGVGPVRNNKFGSLKWLNDNVSSLVQFILYVIE